MEAAWKYSQGESHVGNSPWQEPGAGAWHPQQPRTASARAGTSVLRLWLNPQHLVVHDKCL